MDNIFINRINELSRLNAVSKGLIIVYGRRRVGKSLLIDRYLATKSHSVVSQAIEAAPLIQLHQIWEDLRPLLETELRPETWEQLFELIERAPNPINLCIDEFPYLVNSDASVPSRFQRWIDRRKRKSGLLVLCGSSTTMMSSAALAEDSPLFGRAAEILRVTPMSFVDFLDYRKGKPSERRADFLIYTLVGGVPKYWELVRENENYLEVAQRLFFSAGAYLEREPFRVLKDEKIDGISPLSVLEAIGRGSNRPSEIAARMGVTQGSVSKLLQTLIEASIIERKRPFGESERKSKIVHYQIVDPTLRFWFSVYSPHRSRWSNYPDKKRQQLVAEHAGAILEKEFAKIFPHGSTYWEGDIEIDYVREDRDKSTLTVSEIKWRSLDKLAKERIHRDLIARWNRTKIARKYSEVEFEVLGFEEVIGLLNGGVG